MVVDVVGEAMNTRVLIFKSVSVVVDVVEEAMNRRILIF